MTFEEEISAGVFVDSICLLCGEHAPPEQTVRDCCERAMMEDVARESVKTGESR